MCRWGEWTDEHFRMMRILFTVVFLYPHTHTCRHESWNEKGSQGEDRPQLVECLPGMPRSNLQVQGIITKEALSQNVRSLSFYNLGPFVYVESNLLMFKGRYT